jgi:hypothetical protein
VFKGYAGWPNDIVHCGQTPVGREKEKGEREKKY